MPNKSATRRKRYWFVRARQQGVGRYQLKKSTDLFSIQIASINRATDNFIVYK